MQEERGRSCGTCSEAEAVSVGRESITNGMISGLLGPNFVGQEVSLSTSVQAALLEQRESQLPPGRCPEERASSFLYDAEALMYLDFCRRNVPPSREGRLLASFRQLP